MWYILTKPRLRTLGAKYMLHGKIGFLALFQGGPTTGGFRIPTAMRFVKITPIEAFDLGFHHTPLVVVVPLLHVPGI